MLTLDRIPGDALPHGALASSGRLDARAQRVLREALEKKP
jgi:hypothetical protein